MRKLLLTIFIFLTLNITMAKANDIIPFIKQWEGGFGYHPADPGGATNSGITIGTYTWWCKQNDKPKPTVKDLKNMSDEEWFMIFKTMFADPWKVDSIESQSIANVCIDFGWASGVQNAIKRVQKCLGCVPDGIVGKKTLAALNNPDKKATFDKLIQMRLAYINAIVAKRPASKVFLKGWRRRILALPWKEDDINQLT